MLVVECCQQTQYIAEVSLRFSSGHLQIVYDQQPCSDLDEAFFCEVRVLSATLPQLWGEILVLVGLQHLGLPGKMVFAAVSCLLQFDNSGFVLEFGTLCSVPGAESFLFEIAIPEAEIEAVLFLSQAGIWLK
jgi:hypothetical protein